MYTDNMETRSYIEEVESIKVRSSAQLRTALKHDAPEFRAIAVERAKHISDSDISYILHDTSDSVRAALARRPENLSPDLMETLLTDRAYIVRAQALRRKEPITPAQLHRAWNDPSLAVFAATSSRYDMLTVEQVHVGVTHNVLTVALQFADVPIRMSEDIVRFLLKSKHDALRRKIIQRQEVIEYELLKQIMNGDENDRWSLACSPHQLPDDIIIKGIHDSKADIAATFVRRAEYTPTSKEIQEGLLKRSHVLQRAWEWKARQEYVKAMDMVSADSEYTDFI